MNDPAIKTGEYTDTVVNDELIWAATDLYFATGEESNEAVAFNGENIPSIDKVPAWRDLASLSLFSLVLHEDTVVTNYKRMLKNVSSFWLIHC